VSGEDSVRRPSVPIVVILASCVSVVVTILLSGCGSEKPLPTPSPPHTYVDEDHHFVLLVDQRFEDIYKFTAAEVAYKVGFFDKDGAVPGLTPDGLWVSLVDKKADAKRSARERVAELNRLVGQLEAKAPEGVEWHKTKVDGLPAAWAEDIMPANKYPRISYLVIGSRNVYVIAGASTPQSWDLSRPLFVASAESFKEI
jgi:hypothetical protein